MTHVCRYWRGAIASSQSNWTYIDSRWRQLAPLCLEHAGAAPLTVTISVPDLELSALEYLCGHRKGSLPWAQAHLRDFLQALFPHAARISHLSLSVYPPIERVVDVHPDFFASAPDLTSLEFKNRLEPAKWFPSKEAPMPSLFRNVSKLVSLHLANAPLYPTLFNIASLVELKFVGHKIYFQSFIEFLESNHSLETVVLELTFVKSSVLTAPGRKASLPRLRRLTLTCGYPIDARGLLSCLSFSRGVKIVIQESEPGRSCGDLALFLPSPPTPIQDLLAPITTIKSWHWWIYISGNDGSFSFQSSTNPQKSNQEYDLFDTGTVRQVHMQDCTPYGRIGPDDKKSWPLECLPALEVLIISGPRQGPGPIAALAKDPTLCPSLKTIALLDHMESPEAFRELESMLTEQENSTAARLHRIVIANKRRDMPDQVRSVVRLRELVRQVDIIVGQDLPDLL